MAYPTTLEPPSLSGGSHVTTVAPDDTDTVAANGAPGTVASAGGASGVTAFDVAAGPAPTEFRALTDAVKVVPLATELNVVVVAGAETVTVAPPGSSATL